MKPLPSKTLDVLRAIDSHHPETTDRGLAWAAKCGLSGLRHRIGALRRAGYLQSFGNAPRRRLIVTPKGMAVLRGEASALAAEPKKSASAIHSKPRPQWQRPKAARQGEPKTRPCLMCREAFQSSWSGERVCADCKVTKAWRSPVAAQNVLQGRG